MSGYYYLDLKLCVRNPEKIVLTPAYMRGSIEASLNSFFGEFGGRTSIEIVKFSTKQRRCIFRVPEEFFSRVRTAITLVGHYQEVPCHFKLLNASKDPLDFDEDVFD